MAWPLVAHAPSQCEVCRGWGDALVCARCVRRFGAPRPRCCRCGLGLALPDATCGECLGDPPPFEHTVCAVDYAFPWDALVLALKFNGRVELAAPLAALIARALEGAAPRPAVELVLPVPLARPRLRERGFNQAWELARRVAASRRLPAAADGLMRVLDTSHQAGLSRTERSRNLRAAFAAAPALHRRIAGHRVALVDDVMTTGATAREAAAALRRAGAAAVELWVLARTPAE